MSYLGPPLEQPQSALDATLHCDDATKTLVLFIPITTAEGPENFSWNYLTVLRALGFPVCRVDYPYPTRGWRDMQISSEKWSTRSRTPTARDSARSSPAAGVVLAVQAGLELVARSTPNPSLPGRTSPLSIRGSMSSPPGGQASALGGAAHVAVQDVCPARPVDHSTATYALMLDALNHDGQAVPARVSRSVC